jgi:multimeric flavodoxin WrbA
MIDQTEARGIIIFGSARSDGNTSLVVEELASISGFEVVDLNVLDIGYFDYITPPADDFMPTIRKLLQADVIVFATPVYWYAMSAILKTFFDRFSDLLHWHKEVGRAFRGKSMCVVSTSEKPAIHEAFTFPFKSTARYLGIEYLGHCHCRTEKGKIPEDALVSLRTFAEGLALLKTE